MSITHTWSVVAIVDPLQCRSVRLCIFIVLASPPLMLSLCRDACVRQRSEDVVAYCLARKIRGVATSVLAGGRSLQELPVIWCAKELLRPTVQVVIRWSLQVCLHMDLG